MEALKKSRTITCVSISFMTAVIIPLMSFIYEHSLGEILRNSIFAMFFSLGLAYIYFFMIKTNRLDYDNIEHPYRFLIVYSISLLLCILFPLINSSGWIYLCIAISLALFSNSILGMYITPGLIMFSIFLKGENDIWTFFVYFLAAFIGIILFQDIDQRFDVLHSLIICIFSLFLFETAGFVLLKNKELSFEQFIIPIVNSVINVLAVCFVLKYFNEMVANRYRNKYLELNDQEYKVLLELKQRFPDEYFRTIHTAYLVERIAFAIGCDVDVAKNLAYYHRIKKAFSYSNSACEQFVLNNGFPPKAREAILRFWNKKNKLTTKEEGIVYLSDKIISLIQEVFRKDKNVKIDYAEVYDTMLKKDFVIETLAESDLTFKDMRIIREIILKEKMYYDFLR